MTDEGLPPRPADDIKDMMIGGCRVRLTYGQTIGKRWSVRAIVQCGTEEKAEERSLVTEAFDSRDAAERDAIEQVTALLGHNTDRSYSRVRNWS